MASDSRGRAAPAQAPPEVETRSAVMLFGLPFVRFAGEDQPLRPDRRHQLLAYLAYRGAWQSRGQLAALFWGDSDEAAASRNLRQLLHRVRSLPWARDLEADQYRVRWLVPTDVAQARAALANRDLPAALALLRGPLLQGLEGYDDNAFVEWVELQREQEGSVVREAMLRLVEGLAHAADQVETSAAALERLLSLDPYDDEAMLRLLRLGQAGHRPEQALRSYQAYEQRLRRELGLEPVSDVRRTADALRVAIRSEAGAAARPMAQTVGTSFVGRQAELAGVVEALVADGGRLVTLTGPSGIGKTRLALEVGPVIAGHYPDGVFFVPLLDTPTSAGVPLAIAATLGYKPTAPDAALDELVEHCAGRRMLLILDNLEHLQAGDGTATPQTDASLAATVARLLAAVPGLAVLATSHQRLGLARETLMPIRGLAAPRRDEPRQVVLGSEAVRLFVERATRLDPGFRVERGDEVAILDVCLLVESSPLGIELAAAATRLLSLTEIAQGLRGCGLELAMTAADVPPRHRSLRAAFDYTTSLLRPEDRTALARLAVFRGGFGRSAAAYVAGVSSALLATFVDRSLVTRAAARFDVHPQLRRFLERSLCELPDEPRTTHLRHLDFFAAFLEEPDSRAAGSAYGRWQDAVMTEADNYRAALDRAAEHGAAEQGLRVAGRLSNMWTAGGYLRQGLKHIEDLLAATPADAAMEPHAATIAGALTTAGSLALTLGEFAASQEYFTRSLAAARQAGDEVAVARATISLGGLHVRTGRFSAAHDLFSDCLMRLGPEGNPNLRARLLNNLGALELELGDGDAAERWLREGLPEARSQDDRPLLAMLQFNLGWAARLRGDLAAARSRLGEALGISRDSGPVQQTASIMNSLAIVELLDGHVSEADRLSREAAAVRIEVDDTFGLAFSFEAVAAVAAASGRHVEAALLLGAAAALRLSLHAPLPVGWSGHVDGACVAAEAALGPVEFATRLTEGRQSSLRAAMAWLSG